MEIKIIEILDKEEKKAISKEVLNDLPEWFGLSESTQKYINDSQNKPFVAAYVNDEPVGFMVLSRIVRNFRLHRMVDKVVVFQEGPRPFLKKCRLFFALRRLSSEWPLSTARLDKLSRQTSLPSTLSNRC